MEEAIWYYVYDISIFLKWGISNVPFCSILVPFHFYLVMPLVVHSLDNIFMGFADLPSSKNWCDGPIFLDSGSPREEGGFVRVWARFVINA